MKRVFLIILLTLFVFASGCSGQQQETGDKTSSEDEYKPVVYSSFYPLYDFATKIGGDKIQVETIVPFGAEPHGYEPSAKKVAELARADVLFFLGAGMEGWIEKTASNIGNDDLVMVELSKHVQLYPLDGNEHLEDGQHEHGEYDPHIWLDPLMAKEIAQQMMETLVTVDPRHKDYYEQNYERLAAKLEKLHQDFETGLKNRKSNVIITSHDAFGYLARRYGLETYSIMGISPNAEPTPGQLARLAEMVQDYQVQAIFAEDLLSTQAAEVLAVEAQVEVLSLNPVAGLTEEQIQTGEDYLSLMYKNLVNLKIALGCD